MCFALFDEKNKEELLLLDFDLLNNVL